MTSQRPEQFEIAFKLRKEHDILDFKISDEKIRSQILLENLAKAKKDAQTLEKLKQMMRDMTVKLESEKHLLNISLQQYNDSQRFISKQLSKTLKKYDQARAQRQLQSQRLSSHLSEARKEQDDCLLFLWKSHPKCAFLMEKKNLLNDLRERYQSAQLEAVQEKSNQSPKTTRDTIGAGDQIIIHSPQQADEASKLETVGVPSLNTLESENQSILKASNKEIDSNNMDSGSLQELEEVENIRCDGNTQEKCQNFDEGSQNLAENCNDNILNWTLPAPRDTIATLETAMQRSSVSEINFKPVLLHPSHPEEPMKKVHLAESTPLNCLQLNFAQKSSNVLIPDVTPIPSSFLSVALGSSIKDVTGNLMSSPLPEIQEHTTPSPKARDVSSNSPNLLHFEDDIPKGQDKNEISICSVVVEDPFPLRFTPKSKTLNPMKTPPGCFSRPAVGAKEKRRLIFSPADNLVNSETERVPSDPKSRRSESSFNSSFFNLSESENRESRGFFDSLFAPENDAKASDNQGDNCLQMNPNSSVNFSFNFGKSSINDDFGFSSAFGF